MNDTSVYIYYQMLTIAVFLLLQKPQQAVLETLNNAFLFDESLFPERRSDSLQSCSRQCIRSKLCKSANSEWKCFLFDKTGRTHALTS